MLGVSKNFLCFFIVLFLFSCGGSGGSQDGTGRPPTSERQVTSIGAINSEGQITVNGVEYDVNEAEVTVDDELSSEEALSLGQIVTINGMLDEGGQTGVANTVTINTNIFGPVSLVDTGERLIEVLGQAVRVTDSTSYNGDGLSGFDDIQVHDHLRIIGFRLANGDLSASYIEHVVLAGSGEPGIDGNPFYEVNGKIARLDRNARTFKINGLVVDYSGILSLDELEDGRVVEVLGLSVNADNQFIATSIQLLPEGIAEIETRVELEGFITVFRSIEDFEIDGVLITTDTDTVYVGGDASQLEDNQSLVRRQRLEVEGRINSDGVLVAERVIFLIGHITSHKENDRLGSDTVTFRWTDVQADEYGFHVSSGNDSLSNGWNGQLVIYEQYFDGDVTSATVSNLPTNGALVEIAIGTRRGERWFYQGYDIVSQSILSNAELLSHSVGDSLVSDTATFTWSDVDADEYRLLLFTGDRSGTVHDEYYFGEAVFGWIHDGYYAGDITSVTLDNLPVNGAEITLVLFTRHGQGWANHEYKISAQNLLSNAELSSHVDGESLGSTAATFSWRDVNADAYRVELYSVGRLLHAQTYSNQTSSITLNNLPVNGADLDMRLYTRRGTGWFYRPYKFISHQVLDNAVLLSHAEGEQLSSDVVEFSWSDVVADEYEINVLVGDNLIQAQRYNGLTTSAILRSLPTNGEELTLRLLTRHGQGWATQSYRLISASME